MIVLTPEVSNIFSGYRNLHKKNHSLVVIVIVSGLWKPRSFRRTRNAKIQFFAISSLSKTNNHLKPKLLPKWDWFTIRMYHLRYTQEFQNLFSDELAVFLGKSSIVRYTEEGHLAYSYPHMHSNVCIVISLIDILDLCNYLSNPRSKGVFVIVLVIVSHFQRNRAEKFSCQMWMIISFRFYPINWCIRTKGAKLIFFIFWFIGVSKKGFQEGNWSLKLHKWLKNNIFIIRKRSTCIFRSRN